MRIGIVNDMRLAAEMLRRAVSPGHEVAWIAGDGGAAVTACVRDTPDLILMDLIMPGMDGVEATRRIREARPNACVLMLTGSNAATDIDRSRDAGAAGYVTKDRIASQLVEAIVEAAGR